MFCPGRLVITFGLLELYRHGARKFGIFAPGQCGCTPGMMATYGVNSCVDEVNSAILLFNARLNTTIDDLNNELIDAKFVLIDTLQEYPNDINVTDKPCCEISNTNGKGNCDPNKVPCSNRQNYFFWDSFHPTERVSILDGTKAYESLYPLYSSNAISSSASNETGYVSDV